MTGYLSDAKSAKPTITPVAAYRESQYAIEQRLDPLYEIEWRDILDTEFQGVGGLLRKVILDNTGSVEIVDERVESALVMPKRLTHSQAAIRIVALLTQYHQLTEVQIASFLDLGLKRASNVLASLYQAGVVLRAKPAWTTIASPGDVCVWQVNAGSSAFAQWLDSLSDLEFVLMSGNGDLNKGTQSSKNTGTVRHNLIAAELCLRALEFVPSVFGTWGERASVVTAFLDSKRIHDNAIRSNIGDAVLVTRSGEVIVLETSGQRSIDGLAWQRLQDKMIAWSVIAALSDVKLKVVLVNVHQYASFHRIQWKLIKAIENELSKHFVDHKMQMRAADSIFAANAYDWFPSPMTVGSGFLTLEAWNPRSNKYHDLLDVDAALVNDAAIVNTAAALHISDWVVQHSTSKLSLAS